MRLRVRFLSVCSMDSCACLAFLSVSMDSCDLRVLQGLYAWTHLCLLFSECASAALASEIKALVYLLNKRLLLKADVFEHSFFYTFFQSSI